MKFTLQDVKAAYPPEKQKDDSLWARIIIRELSFYVAWIAIRLNMTAFTVSVISLLLPLIAMYFWLTADALIAIILLNVWLLLDCADGNVARATGGTKMGSFVDATSGYMIVAFSFFGLGAYLDLTSTSYYGISMPGFILIGATTSILSLLARLYYQKYMNVHQKSVKTEAVKLTNPTGMIKTIDHNIGIGGFFTPFLFVGYYLELLAPMLLLYSIYTVLYFLGITVKLLQRSKN